MARFRRFSARREQVGVPPGTITGVPEGPPPRIRVLSYDPQGFDAFEVEDVDELTDLSGRREVTWVNVDGLGDAETLTRIGKAFDIHPLAMEDVVHLGQRPKVEQYGSTLFVVTRMATLDERVETEQISLVLGAGFVVTFQERPGDCLDPVRTRIRQGLGQIRRSGADYLLYCLLDAVIDAYFPVVESLGERLDEIEKEVMSEPDEGVVPRIFRAKQDLMTLRRVTWPQRDALSSLQRGECDMIGEQTLLFVRDAYDHIAQIMDALESDRELASGLFDAYQNRIANRMNEIMKVLTIIATIFIPLGFIAGVYGMNFDPEASRWNMPELSWRLGYPFALGLMLALALAMVLMFLRMGWLGRRRR
jgi:magnesium transporter